MQRIPLWPAALLLITGQPALAWHFEYRFVERVGSQDLPLAGSSIDASSGAPRAIRLQFGAFDDADGHAPDAGVIGWRNGSISVGGAVGNSDETRTPGRLAPFHFSDQPGANGRPPLPAGDPFTALTGIDATYAVATLQWFCDADGAPLPLPTPVRYGLNTFVSIYAITIDPRPGAESYAVSFMGEALTAPEWRLLGNPVPPDCDTGEPGSAVYFPYQVAPESFTRTLNVIVPAPATAAACVALGCIGMSRRRRRTL